MTKAIEVVIFSAKTGVSDSQLQTAAQAITPVLQESQASSTGNSTSRRTANTLMLFTGRIFHPRRLEWSSKFGQSVKTVLKIVVHIGWGKQNQGWNGYVEAVESVPQTHRKEVRYGLIDCGQAA